MVMEVLQEDMGEGNIQCTDHPYKNNTPGGICAFCLQEKLGKLVSSSFPITIFPSSSSSSTSSFRSDFSNTTTTSTLPNPKPLQESHNPNNNRNGCHYHQYYSTRSRIPFLQTHKKKKKKDLTMSSDSDTNTIIFKRSKSTTTPRHFVEHNKGTNYTSQKRGLWSFLYFSKQSTPRKIDGSYRNPMGPLNNGSFSQRDKKKEDLGEVGENESPKPNPNSLDRKVSRSRSVGCGSRSFSGDFFERISTGFGDCTLRRVESQREGKSKGNAAVRGGCNGGQDCIKERVKCGGLFSGFMITSTSSSSSWVSSTDDNVTGKSGPPPSAVARSVVHGRSRSWGWAFASPIRAFSKTSGKKEGASNNINTTPNLAAIPSLLAVRS